MKPVHIRWNLLGLIVGSSLLILILYKLVDIGGKGFKGHTYKGTPKQPTKFSNPRGTFKDTIASVQETQQTKSLNPRGTFKDGNDITTRKTRVKKLMELSMQSLLEANMYIRSSKAKTAMFRAINLFKDVLKLFNINVPSRIRKSSSTCPEIYHGTSFGYPLFHEGFEFQNCTNQVPVDGLVSIIILCQESYVTTFDLDRLVRSVQLYNNKLSVIIALPSSQGSDFKQLGNINIVQFGHKVSPGSILNKFASIISTKYTLIARELQRLDHDSYIERLVSEIETLNATVVGGATRDQNGLWRKGCNQMVYQNHTLVLQEGYVMSLRECIRCDFIEGPFLVRTEMLKSVRFDEHITGPGLVEDFFLRLQQDLSSTSFVCPDSMFYVSHKINNTKNDDWKMFGRKWDMRRIILPTGQKINIDCPIDYKCLFWKGFSVSPCCLEELTILVKFIMSTCRQIGALCELQEGTLLGAVKLHKILPWERDADITFLSSNFSALAFMSGLFKMKGYAMNIDKRPKWTEDGVATGGKIVISSKHWHVELYGQHDMDSKEMLTSGETPTKVLLNGDWVNAPRNPGLYVRNRYGFRVYAHSEHWMETGKKTGWAEYATDTFLACSQPGYHNCLDRYNGDGNLQFNNPIP